MNIQNLTLEQISIAILFVVGLIGGVKYLKSEIKNGIKEFLDKELDARFKVVNDKLDDMQESINDLDVYTTKNFLVRFLSDVEREDYIYEQEKQRFWEEYDHYKDDLKENSYIKEWVEQLKKEGKLQRPSTEGTSNGPS